MIEDIEDESDQRQFLRRLLDAVLPPATGGQLEREVLLQLLAIGDRLAVEDEGVVFEPLRSGGELGEHQRVVLEVAREDTHRRAVFVDLHADAVVLRLDGHQSQPLDHGLWVGQALGKLTPDRPSDGDLERVDLALPIGPEGLRDQAEVRHPVVRCFKHWPKRLIALLRKRQGIEHGGIADAEPQPTERHAHQVFG